MEDWLSCKMLYIADFFVCRRNIDVDVVILLEDRHTIVIPAPAHSMHSVLFKPPTNAQGYYRP
jgi:hypothetical protein